MQWLTNLLKSLPHPFPVFAERFDKSPVTGLDQLAQFVRTRSSYIAQTSMYGYLKTRMGTSFRRIFEDQEFAQVIHTATVKLFGSCLCDFAIYSAAHIFHSCDEQTKQQPQTLALYLYDRCIAEGLSDESKKLIDQDLRTRFSERLAQIDWQHIGTAMRAFGWSEADLVRHAPVIESYKQLDAEIVQNSIRFRWVDICEQAKSRYLVTALRTNWENTAAPQKQGNA